MLFPVYRGSRKTAPTLSGIGQIGVFAFVPFALVIGPGFSPGIGCATKMGFSP